MKEKFCLQMMKHFLEKVTEQVQNLVVLFNADTDI